ncbi:hypothetical protein [Streptomyces gardneri]
MATYNRDSAARRGLGGQRGEEAEDPTVLIGRAFAVLASALDRETR